MTAAECLDMALNEERLARDCGVHDPAFAFLIRERDWWLNEAARLEEIENQVT
jgi:hypothetical protein